MTQDSVSIDVAVSESRPVKARSSGRLPPLRPQLIHSLGFAGGTVLYTLALTWSYAYVESVIFGYRGVVYNPPPLWGRIAAYAFAVAPSLWLEPAADRPSSVALSVFYALVYVPFALIAPHVLPWPLKNVLLLELFLMANLCVMRVLSALRRRPISAVPIRERDYFLGLGLITVALSVITAAVNGFKIDLSVTDVYTRRLAARDTVAAGSIVAYAIALLANTFLPVCLCVAMARRQRFLLGASLIAVVTLFSLAGQKSVLLLPVMIIGAYTLIRWVPAWFGASLSIGLACLIVVADVAALVFGNVIPSAAFTYRLLAGATVNMSRYFEFFDKNPVYLLSGGILHSVLDSPYARPMTMMMGDLYDPSGLLNLNTNVWPTAFGDGGYLGVVIASFLIGLILWLFDSLCSQAQRTTITLFGVFLGFLLAAMALPTALVTGGLVASMIVLYLLSGTVRPYHERLGS